MMRLVTRSSRLAVAVALLGVAACHADPDTGGNQKNVDAGEEILKPPSLSAAALTPLSTVALRGKATGATRVVIKPDGSNTSQVSPLLPGGDYCVDADLPAAATTTFKVYAVAESGIISEPSSVDVTQDDSAATPADATCSDTGTCGTEEICDNSLDDNCDGLKDQCDPQCNQCQDDYLEPNDTPFEVPIVQSDSYRELKICPCRDDWYSLPVPAGGRVHVIVTFNKDAIDIDLKLYEAATAEQDGTPVATSASVDGTEEIDYTSTNGGFYYLKVYGFSADTPNTSQGTYDMTVDLPGAPGAPLLCYLCLWWRRPWCLPRPDAALGLPPSSSMVFSAALAAVGSLSRTSSR